MVGAVAEPLEHAADRIAEQVTRLPGPQRARQGPACAKADATTLRAKPERAPGDLAGVAAPPIVHEALSRPGEPLDAATRDFFEPRLGHDLAAVRVHRDAQAADSAAAVEARAYTVGSAIAFARGRYAPASEAGRRLLAHELVHVIQQAAAGPALQRAPDPPDKAPAGGAAGPSSVTCYINFVRDRDEFTKPAEYAACSASIRAYLAADPARKVALLGFASVEGDAASNRRLSQKRADKVKSLLVGQDKVDAARLTATGLGADSSYPTPEANRRVEVLTGDQQNRGPGNDQSDICRYLWRRIEPLYQHCLELYRQKCAKVSSEQCKKYQEEIQADNPRDAAVNCLYAEEPDLMEEYNDTCKANMLPATPTTPRPAS